MRIYTIVIGGLEKKYMQKLALYLNGRLGNAGQVEIAEHWEEATEHELVHRCENPENPEERWRKEPESFAGCRREEPGEAEKGGSERTGVSVRYRREAPGKAANVGDGRKGVSDGCWREISAEMAVQPSGVSADGERKGEHDSKIWENGRRICAHTGENRGRKGPQPHAVWQTGIGSEAFVRYLQEQKRAEQTLILTEDGQEDETHIFRYQSCSCLYRKLSARGALSTRDAAVRAGKKQCRYVIAGCCGAGELAAFSTLCAWTLAREERVLYLDLAECSGWQELFGVGQPEADISDLIFALRREEAVVLDDFTSRLDSFDFIFPTENPMILHEITAEDMQTFLNRVLRESDYTATVFSLGTMVRGCEYLLSGADQVIYLTGASPAGKASAAAGRRFLDRCLGNNGKEVTESLLPNLPEGEMGVHLLYEWSASPAGRLAVRLMKREENSNGMAGSERTDFSENRSDKGYFG